MSLRMKVVNEKNIKLSDIHEIVRSMKPFDGAEDFLKWARQNFQVSIVSDTFYELAWPLVEKLNYPTIICHHLKVKDDQIVDYSLRQKNNKQNNEKSFGFIAQEVKEIFPNMVKENEGLLSMDYIQIIPLCVKTIQTQKTKIC